MQNKVPIPAPNEVLNDRKEDIKLEEKKKTQAEIEQEMATLQYTNPQLLEVCGPWGNSGWPKKVVANGFYWSALEEKERSSYMGQKSSNCYIRKLVSSRILFLRLLKPDQSSNE